MPERIPFEPGDFVETFDAIPISDSALYEWVRKVGRRYQIVKSLEETPTGRTSYTYRVLAYPPKSDPEGVKASCQDEFVLKVPRLDQERYTRQDTVEHAARIQQKASGELRHITSKIKGIRHANPIFDLFLYKTYDDLVIPLTVQPLLSDRLMLRKWCEQYLKDTRNRCTAFLPLAITISHALEVLHTHRVVHGDIHPGNIFISPPGSNFDLSALSATFIDFGESFLSDPGRNYRQRHRHPYLAPEWLDAARMTEAIDVFSFGMLLIYLATGKDSEPIDATRLRKNEQQDEVEQRLNSAGFVLDVEDRRIPNLIAHCLSHDPAARPRISEVVDELLRVRQRREPNWTFACGDCGGRWERAETIDWLRDRKEDLINSIQNQRSNAGAAPLKIHPLINPLLNHEIDRVAAMCAGLQREMLEIHGTREQILQSLVCLFDQLESGDSWTVGTTLDMWQRDALGLGGRLGSAAIRLSHRGASLRRVLIVSVQELGLGYAESLVSGIRTLHGPNGHLARLADQFDEACGDYCASIGKDTFRKEPLMMSDDSKGLNRIEQLSHFLSRQSSGEQRVHRWHQDRWRKVVRTIVNLVDDWGLGGKLCREESFRLWSNDPNDSPHPGDLLFAIHPVGTLLQVEQLRADNPAAVIYCQRTEEADRWLLATIDGRGSRPTGRLEDFHRIHIDRLRIFKSTVGVPVDRKTHLSQLFASSANMGACCTELLQLMESINGRPERAHDDKRFGHG